MDNKSDNVKYEKTIGCSWAQVYSQADECILVPSSYTQADSCVHRIP